MKDEKLDRLIYLTEDMIIGVDPQLRLSTFTETEERNSTTIFADAKTIIHRNPGVAQGIECFYYIFQLWNKHLGTFSAATDALMNDACDQLYDRINDAMNEEPLPFDAKKVGEFVLEAIHISQGTLGSRGLMWEMNEKKFSEEDCRKLNRLTEIAEILTRYDPSVAKAVQLLNGIVRWRPEERDRDSFKGNMEHATKFVDDVSAWLSKLYFLSV